MPIVKKRKYSPTSDSGVVDLTGDDDSVKQEDTDEKIRKLEVRPVWSLCVNAFIRSTLLTRRQN